VTTKPLADLLKKGLALDDLPDLIREVDQWARSRPDVGGVAVDILRQIEGRWTGYALPPDEYRKVYDTVVPPLLEILRKLDEVPRYQPLDDLRDLRRAYDALND
jgi:hypothetical protein